MRTRLFDKVSGVRVISTLIQAPRVDGASETTSLASSVKAYV